MAKTAAPDLLALTEPAEVFEKAAEVFRVMSAPMRLRILSALSHAEKSVGELLAEIDTTQPNMSQHLGTLYQAGVVDKRRDGVQIYYGIVSAHMLSLYRGVCEQMANGFNAEAQDLAPLGSTDPRMSGVDVARVV